MGERKVLNKYYPPDLENFKLPKLNPNRSKQYVVRLMIPFTMRCMTCGNHIYHGKKFNARKETVEGEKYLGMPIFRFYIRCPLCLSEISFKTDPENTDYAAETGAYRTFQAETIAQREAERKKQEKEEEEANNPMLALENRTKESRREMDILDVLEEIKDINSQKEGITFDELMERHLEYEREEVNEEEQVVEAITKAAFDTHRRKIQRLKDDDDELLPSAKKLHESNVFSEKTSKQSNKSKLSNLVKRKVDNKPRPSTPPTTSAPPIKSSLGLLSTYDNSSSDSDN